MRLISRIFSRRAGGDGGRSPCRRWERSLYLSVSGDLPEGAARALGRHIARCPPCRAESRRIRALRDRCAQVSFVRGPRPSVAGPWAIPSAVVGRSSKPFPALSRGDLDLGWRPRPSSARRHLLVAASIAAAVLVGAWVLLPSHTSRDRAPGAGATVVEDRWSREWDEFVSGSDGTAEIVIDPFASEIPNPEVIDF